MKMQTAKRSSVLGWLSLVAVYIFWGSTYFAIRIGVRTTPPLVLASIRYLIPGIILCAVYWRTLKTGWGQRRLAGWVRSAAIIGLLLLMGGNGGVSVGETRVNSSVAAVLVATVPMWMVLIDAVRLRRPVPLSTGLGILLGLAGTAILVDPGAVDHIDYLGGVLILAASLSWAIGSLFSRTAPLPPTPLAGVGLEMLAGGLWLGAAGLVTSQWQAIAFSQESLVALGYLIVFGSIVGFSCYIYVLRVLPTSTVGTYAFVNPVVAIVMGVTFLGEGFSPRTALAVAVILVGVVLILLRPAGTRPTAVPRD